MKGENIQLDLQDRIDELRKELDPKIDRKISDNTFWTIIGFIVLILMGISAWLMNLNQRTTCVETKVEMMRPAMTQETLPSIPTKK